MEEEDQNKFGRNMYKIYIHVQLERNAPADGGIVELNAWIIINYCY